MFSHCNNLLDACYICGEYYITIGASFQGFQWLLHLRLPHQQDYWDYCCDHVPGIRVLVFPCVRVLVQPCVPGNHLPGTVISFQMTYSMIVLGNHKGLYEKWEIVEIKCLGEGNRITNTGLLFPLTFPNCHYAFWVFLYTMICSNSHRQCRTCPWMFFLFFLRCTL